MEKCTSVKFELCLPNTTKGKNNKLDPSVLESTQRSESESWTSFPHKLREKDHGEHTPCDAQESTRGVSYYGLAIYINK